MKVNPDKFQAIAIGKNTQSKNISFNLNGNIIKTEDEVKLLGVTIDYELKFNSHITNICRKASRQLNVLKRMGKYLNRLGKLTIYHSFILSNFNYCPVIWHFCSEANTKKMEKIHERALKFTSLCFIDKGILNILCSSQTAMICMKEFYDLYERKKTWHIPVKILSVFVYFI